MTSYNRTSSLPQAAQKQPAGRVPKQHGMFIGYVKDNQDGQYMGRLKVWIPEFGSSPDDPSGWLTVSYLSPFGGASSPTEIGKNNVSSFDATQTSYGMWMVPPDLENQVAVMFANGDTGRGFWFGCAFQQNMNHMIPGYAASEQNYERNGTALPVGEYNKSTLEKVNPQTISKPVAPLAEGLKAQGLVNDSVRGATKASARRESPSQVFGIMSPGPKNSNGKGRTGGSQLVMDDGVGSESITLRTKSGAQIKIDETFGFIYIINKKGTAWIELDEDGNIDIFAAKSVSMNALEDVNLRASRDVNIEGGRNVNIKAASSYASVAASTGASVVPGTGDGGNIVMHSTKDTNITSDQNTFITQTAGTFNLKGEGDFNFETGAVTNIKSTGNIAIASGGDIGVSGSGTLFALAGIIHLNGPAGPAPGSATAATKPVPVAKTSVLSGTVDNGFSRLTQPGVQTIASRMPTFEPCPEHKR